jgi:Flp pilus assembly protein TadG
MSAKAQVPVPVRAPVRPRRDAGQALVEFSMVIIVFGIAFFGFIDGVRLVYLNSTLSQAAREGARLASVEASWVGSTDSSCATTGGPVCPATVDALKAQVVTAANRMTVPFGTITNANVFLSCDATSPPSGTWAASSCTTRDPGSLVSVRVTYSFSAITPVLGQILGPVVLSGSATMAID